MDVYFIRRKYKTYIHSAYSLAILGKIPGTVYSTPVKSLLYNCPIILAAFRIL